MKGFHMTKWLAVSMTAGWHISRPAVSQINEGMINN